MIVLANKGEEQKIVEEEKEEWIREVLSALGVPEEAFELEDIKEYLITANIEIWNNAGESIDIYKDEEIVAQWKGVEFVLIKDKPLYYELHIDAWAGPLQNLEK